MKFIRITPDNAINVRAIDRITKNVDGFAVIHIGIEQFNSSFPYESLLSLISMESKSQSNVSSDGPNPTSTALAY